LYSVLRRIQEYIAAAARRNVSAISADGRLLKRLQPAIERIAGAPEDLKGWRNRRCDGA